MKVRDLVGAREVVSIHPEATALEAARKMAGAGIGALLVRRPDGQVAGIFTERDLMVRVVAAGRPPAEVRLSEVATREVFMTDPDADVLGLREELRRRHIRHVPVVEHERVIAVLSMRDLMRAALEEERANAHEMRRYIQGGGFP